MKYFFIKTHAVNAKFKTLKNLMVEGLWPCTFSLFLKTDKNEGGGGNPHVNQPCYWWNLRLTARMRIENHSCRIWLNWNMFYPLHIHIYQRKWRRRRRRDEWMINQQKSKMEEGVEKRKVQGLLANSPFFLQY